MSRKDYLARVRSFRWSPRRWGWATVAVALGLGAVVYAGADTSPYIFASGDLLSAAKLNGYLKDIHERLSKLERPTLYCTHIDNLPEGTHDHYATFTADDCGGTAPDASYHGALSEFLGCNGFNAINISPGPKGIWYNIDGNGVESGCIPKGATTAQYQIRAVFSP